jgi:hypothetical protein
VVTNNRDFGRGGRYRAYAVDGDVIGYADLADHDEARLWAKRFEEADKQAVARLTFERADGTEVEIGR